jgi:outer membrane receptor for ferrienterochelin and colicins
VGEAMTVSLLGLGLLTIMANGQDTPPDLASLDLESLLNTKVTTASKFAQDVSDAPGIITVVSQDELRRFAGITLREVLERVPGLNGTSSYFTDRSMVAVRGDQTGIDGGHILILINGRPTREVMEGGIISDMLESFPVNALERIEVIKGPGSVLYGSNAFSGVINLITKKAADSGIAVTGLGGPAGANATSGQVSVKTGDLNIFGAAQYHQQPNWTTTYLFPTSVGTPSVQDITIQDHGPGAYLGASYNGLSFMSSFTEWAAPSFVPGTVGETRWRRGFGDLGYRLEAGAKWTMNFDLTYTRTTLAAPGNADIGRDSNEAIAEWTNLISLTDKDQLTAGVLFNHIEGRETYFGDSPSLVIAQGGWPGGSAYAQLDHQFLRNLSLVGGFQANKVGDFAPDVVPRGGIIWTLAPRVGLKALYSQAFRAPSLDEILLNHPGLEGDPNLVPEKVTTFDVELGYRGKHIQAAVSVFHSKQTNSIVIETVTPRWQYVNQGQARFHGGELEVKYYLKTNYYVLGSALYQTNDNGTGQSNVTPVPNFSAKGGLSYEAPRGLTVSVFDIYEGAMSGYDAALNPVPAPHHTLNAQVRYDLSKYLGVSRKACLALIGHATDLINKQVWLPDWGDNSGDTIPVQRGRTIYAGIEISSRRK